MVKYQCKKNEKGVIKMNIKVTGEYQGNWVEGVINNGEFGFQAKVFEEGSKYGINNGRISLLYIWEGEWNGVDKCFIVYEREWDLKPKTTLQREILNSVVSYFE